jgi:hypothetical protein
MYQCVGASEQRFGRRDVQRLGPGRDGRASARLTRIIPAKLA